MGPRREGLIIKGDQMWTFYRENETYSGGPALNKIFLSWHVIMGPIKEGLIIKMGPNVETYSGGIFLSWITL